jgi:HEAT repeat protein
LRNYGASTSLAACAGRDASVREAAIGQLELLFHLRSEIPRSDVKERVLRALRSALADGSPQVRTAAAWTLSSLGSAATSAVVDLERALDGTDLGLRVLAATALLRIDPVHTRSRVIAAMRALRVDDSIPWQDQGPRVIQILTEQEGEDAVAAMLIPLLKPQEMTRRHQAITELIAHCPGSTALMATLDDCLKSDDGGVRCEAALYLLQHQPALAVPALLETADEEDLSISAAAIESLARIEPATAAALKRAIETGALRSRDD